MSLLMMFPGQGAQRAHMLHALPELPEVVRTLEQASDVIGTDCLLLDTPSALASTYAVQLCLLIAGVAMARVFAARGIVPAMVAGLSIGAFPAAVSAGALEYADALRMVIRRGQLMQQAYPAEFGMAAINGVEQQQLETIIAGIHSEATPVYLANLNGPRQLVIAGSNAALQRVQDQALISGATKTLRLAMSVPSHCPLLDQAAAKFQQEFVDLPLQRPRLTYLSASAARAVWEPDAIRADVINNMARQVRWSDTLRLAWERGARLAIELPSGTVLTQLTATQWSEGRALACDDTRLDTLIALAERENAN